MVQQQAPAPTWVGQARRRDQTIGTIIGDTSGLGFGGAPQPFDLPNVGYVDLIKVIAQQSFTTGATTQAAPDLRGIYSGGISRLTIVVNSIGNLFDVDGDLAALISSIDSVYRNGSGRFLAPPTVSHNTTDSTFGVINQTLTASKAYTDQWSFHVPLGLQLANLPYPIGLFQTALQNLSVRAVVRFLPLGITTAATGNAFGGVYGNGATAAATAMSSVVQLNERYFDPIAAPSAQPYLGYIHRWTQFNVPINGSGDVTLNLPGQNQFLRLVFCVVAGTAGALAPQGNLYGGSNYLQRARLMYGANYAPFDFDESKGELTAHMRELYGPLMDGTSAVGVGPGWPAGYYAMDFITATHDNRDWINAAATTNLRLVLTMGTSGTYGSGSYVALAMEEVAPLTLPAAASVQGSAAIPVGAVPGAG